MPIDRINSAKGAFECRLDINKSGRCIELQDQHRGFVAYAVIRNRRRLAVRSPQDIDRSIELEHHRGETARIPEHELMALACCRLAPLERCIAFWRIASSHRARELARWVWLRREDRHQNEKHEDRTHHLYPCETPNCPTSSLHLPPRSELVPGTWHLVPDTRQIRSKFFSTSRRVMRNITGRPCGHTVEYAVARSSSRMCRIFSIVSG